MRRPKGKSRVRFTGGKAWRTPRRDSDTIRTRMLRGTVANKALADAFDAWRSWLLEYVRTAVGVDPLIAPPELGKVR